MSTNSTPRAATLDQLTGIAEQHTPFTLPDASARSGRPVVVELRRIHPMQLARQGALPDTLAGIALASLGLTEAKQTAEERGIKDVAGEYMDMIAATAAAVIASPVMDRNQAAKAMSFLDLQAVFEWATGEAGDLARFRDPAEVGVAAVGDSEDVADAAE